MQIKQHPEDFIVEEIHEDGVSSIDYPIRQRINDLLPKKKSGFLHCDLVKRNYTTERAVSSVSRVLNISKKRVSYAGKKDKMALTSQRISIRDIGVKRLKIKDILLKNFRYSDKMVKMGDLRSNKFAITLRDIDTESKLDLINEFISQSKSGVKNYFGSQRFGTRCNNHIIGKRIVRGNFEAAVKLFLTDTGNEKEDIKKSRRWLYDNWGDWKQALERFPKVLGLERSVLEYLSRRDGNFIGSIRKMPKMISLLFIHAYQAHIFNCCLDIDNESRELPLVGYNTRVDGILKDILKDEGIKPSDFKIREIPFLSCRGTYRKTRIFPRDFRVITSTKDSVTLGFMLESGAYATIIIKELARFIGDHVEEK
jgi:tRNA pseudouridine13 synthase